MDLAGEFTFDGPQDIVWDAVRDPDVLGSVLPGGEGITEIAENEYEGKLKLKVGPVQGKFKGNIKLLNIDEPTGYDIAVDGKGAPGFVKATGNLKLTGQGEKTHMVYTGNARIGGKIASVGQRLMDASSKAIINQSLIALNEYIKVQVQRRDVEANGGTVEAAADDAASAAAETTTVVTETVTVETAANNGVASTPSAAPAPAAAAPPRPTYTAPPPKMPEYKPPSQTELMLNVTAEILDDLVPKTLQPIVLSVATTLITMFVVKLFSRKK